MNILAANLAAQSSLQQVASGIAAPVFVTSAPGDANRLFIVEQGSTGTANIRVKNQSTGDISTYLTISGLATGGERGLLGLAFHPDFNNNGYLYVNATIPGAGGGTTVVRRYTAIGDPATSNSADPASAFPILSFAQPFTNHNGGWLGFNPNLSGSDPQYLYIATGDGGSANDPGNRAQDITNQRLGKMLRIDVNGDDFPANPNENYAVPPTNPFVGVDGDDEIWAYGLRNPWRNSFDRLTGDLWIGDVGQNAWEEINFQPVNSPGGENYGWRVHEGTSCFDNSMTGGNPPCNDADFTFPVYVYPHNSTTMGGFSVSGGYLYRGSVAQFEGLYFFGDHVTNNRWTLDPYAVNTGLSVINRNSALSPNVGTVSGVSSFGEDADGEVYVMSYNNGGVYRISSTARTSVWDGSSAVGNPGDGTTWGDANNWSRDGVPDTAFQTRDKVDFAAASAIQLKENRQVGGVVFSANGVSLNGNTLTVLSGNIDVHQGVTATINSALSAETVNTSIRKRGDGRLNVNGPTGQTVVLGGTLGGNGTLQYLKAFAGTRVAPGEETGVLSVTVDYTHLADAVLEIELNGPAPGVDFDQLAVGGVANLDGVLALQTLVNYSEPTPGSIESFDIVTAGGIVGTFEQVEFNGVALDPTIPGPNGLLLSHVDDGLFRGVKYTNNAVTLVNYNAIPGDANVDGVVDGSDFNIWNSHKFTSGNTWLTGDFNGDGTTDGSDFNVWNSNKFTALPDAVVPEPVTSLLPIAAFVAMFCRRRHSK